MSKVRLTFGLGAYDRHMPLITGEVQAEGIELVCVPLVLEELFWRQAQFREFDVAEFSGCGYLMLRSRQDCPFVAIPAFPSRAFRHNAIFVNVGAGIERPEDLTGKRMGVPEYEMTAVVWARDVLEKEYGVKPTELEWVQGGQVEPGRKPRVAYHIPGLSIQPAPEGRAIDEMLDKGEIDALMAPRVPWPMQQGSPNIRRLFPNYKQVESDYYRRTRHFPIMHTVVIKNEVYERYPWVAVNLYKALVEAKAVAQRRLEDRSANYVTMPFLVAASEEGRDVFGSDPWHYGADEPDYPYLAQIAHEQGLADRLVDYNELYAPSTYDLFKV